MGYNGKFWNRRPAGFSKKGRISSQRNALLYKTCYFNRSLRDLSSGTKNNFIEPVTKEIFNGKGDFF